MDHPHTAPEEDLGHYLSAMVAHAASDLFLSSGTPAAVKVQGVVRRLQEAPLSAEHQATGLFGDARVADPRV